MSVLLTFVLGIILYVAVSKVLTFWSRSKVCLVGKTAIVTGAASGLGFQTALALASKGCRIVIADISNIDKAVEEARKISHNNNIIGKKIDLQSFRSVRSFASNILETEPRLDILICNAGIGDFRVKRTTEDGLEKTIQVNYLSHFLLTHLLLDLLKKSAPSRITFTSSLTAYLSTLTIDTIIPEPEFYNLWFNKINGGVYSNSKLAMAAAAKLFGEKLEGTGVTANAVLPGVARTPIFLHSIKNDRNWLAIAFLVYVYLTGKTSEEGAQTLIHIAQSDEVTNITGRAFVEGVVFPWPFQLTNDFCDKLWEESIRIINMEPHEVRC